MAGDDKPAEPGGNRPTVPVVKDREVAVGRDGRRHNNRRGNRQSNINALPVQTAFKGRVEALKGHVYDCSDHKQAELFTKTTKEISGYVGREFRVGGDDVRRAVDSLALPVFTKPTRPVSTDEYDKIEWVGEMKIYQAKMAALEEGMKRLYNLVYGQCSEIMIQKLMAMDDFETEIVAKSDALGLLKSIKQIAFNFESQKFEPHTIHDAMKQFYSHKQGPHTTPQAYLEEFINNVDVLTYCGGTLGMSACLGNALAKERNIVITTLLPLEQHAIRMEARDRYLGTALVLGADKHRYGGLIRDIENSYLNGINKYPMTVTSAFNLLVNWKGDPSKHTRPVVSDGVAFTNDGVALATPGRARRDTSTVDCHNCGELGHYAYDCTKPRKQTGDQLLMAGMESGEFDGGERRGFNFLNDAQESRSVGITLNSDDQHGRIPKTWILLDNQSTVDVFHNEMLLERIRVSENGHMDIHCNAGVTSTNLVGDLPGYGTVWYHPKGIANILSLNKVKAKYRVTYDSTDGNAFVVHKNDGTTRTFKQSARGLFYMDTTPGTGTTLVNTVAENKSNYTNRDYSRAELARQIQKRIGRPSTRAFLKIVENKLLPNCPITREDILAAEHIFGPDVGSLKGKTVHRTPERVHARMNVLPIALMSRYRDVSLGGDIMFINKIPFFMTISRNIRFGTSESLFNQSSKTIMAAIKTIKQLYSQRGFRITQMMMDGQFENLRGDLADMQIGLNTVSNDEHVPDIERHIRTIKERTRSMYNMLPFKKMPQRLTIEMVSASTFWWNSFPPEGGVSDTMSPRAIVTGQEVDYMKHCQLEFGTYVQTHEHSDNTMQSRTTGAIAMRPTGNEQGGYYFFSLSTGRRLNRNRWTVLPMPNEVIDRVHHFARSVQQGLTFADRGGLPDDGDPFDSDGESYHSDDDTDDDESLHYDDDDDPHDDNDIQHDRRVATVPFAGVNNQQNDNGDGDGEYQPNENNNGNGNEESDSSSDEESSDDDSSNDDSPSDYDSPSDEESEENDNDTGVDTTINEEAVTIKNTAANHQTTNDNAEEQQQAVDAAMDLKYGRRSARHGLRPRRPRDYDHLHTTLESIMLSQYSMKQGLKMFGTDGTSAVLAELSQIHNLKVVDPKNANDLTREQKKAALEYLMFLKKKRCGRIKGRGCEDGRKQREYTSKEDASSPTVSIEALMLSCVIDAKEERDVATVDIPGAFMQADMDELVHMRLEGTMAELLVRLDPKLYRKYVQTVNGKSVLYVELKKALYGTMRAALLFWKLLTSKLVAMGFEINPYDWCVANKTINSKQCTIVWHVDDLKISHVDPEVVTSVIKLLEVEFAKDAPLTIMRGKVHEYLGMTLDYNINGKVQVKMFDYIENMLKELPEDMDGESATPAANHLFEVNADNPEVLSKEKADFFHHYVAKLLFLCKRARPDIQTAVAFLCTRVKGPDIDDYKKLTRVMRYLRSTAEMPLMLQADNMHVMKWWVDASFAVHPDMKSHTGGAMSLGRGAVYGTSTRQKINTTSSTEAETVGIHEVLPQILWTRYFLEAQGYGVEESVVYQDNQSAILLAKNGRGSSSKRTRHINIRYFFVADRIASKEVKVEYCPTGEMIADYFTKPLQGTLFRKFRDFIMNIDPLPTMARLEDRRSVLELIPEEAGSRHDSNNPGEVKESHVMDEGQTKQVWTVVDHGKGKNHRQRILKKKILEKRGE